MAKFLLKRTFCVSAEICKLYQWSFHVAYTENYTLYRKINWKFNLMQKTCFVGVSVARKHNEVDFMFFFPQKR